MKLVYGVGINDADYNIRVDEVVGYRENGKPLKKMIWACPFYARWTGMFQRCYSQKYQKRQPTYVGCSVIPEWHYFMTFRAWMEKQDWQGKELDKDLLFPGNKIYGPESCVFIERNVNSFILERENDRGEWPIGVYFDEDRGKFRAQCWDVSTGKQRYLGRFQKPEEANQAWLSFKLEQAKILASQQSDLRIAKALIDRYENYGEW